MEENIQINPEINNKFIPSDTNIDNKKAMGSFVLSIVSLILNISFIFPVAGLITGIISLALSNQSEKANRNPHKIFRRISLPLSIFNIAYSGIVIIIHIAVSIILIVRALIEHGVIRF